MPDAALPDLERVASDLAAATKRLDHFINAEAQKRAATMAKNYAKAADERIREREAELQQAAAEMQAKLDHYEWRIRCLTWLENRLRELATMTRERGVPVPYDVLLKTIGDAQKAGRDAYERDRAAGTLGDISAPTAA